MAPDRSRCSLPRHPLVNLAGQSARAQGMERNSNPAAPLRPSVQAGMPFERVHPPQARAAHAPAVRAPVVLWSVARSQRSELVSPATLGWVSARSRPAPRRPVSAPLIQRLPSSGRYTSVCGTVRFPLCLLTAGQRPPRGDCGRLRRSTRMFRLLASTQIRAGTAVKSGGRHRRHCTGTRAGVGCHT